MKRLWACERLRAKESSPAVYRNRQRLRKSALHSDPSSPASSRRCGHRKADATATHHIEQKNSARNARLLVSTYESIALEFREGISTTTESYSGCKGVLMIG